MKKFVKKSLALLMVIAMVFSFVPNLSVYVDAADYTYNWGVRGETADGLSSAATAFYQTNGVNYTSLSAYAGAASTDDVPDSELYGVLQTLMTENHTYVNSYDAAKTFLPYTDCQNEDGVVYGFYTNTAMGTAWGEGDVQWSREHIWPNSKGLDGKDEDDIMMLRPEVQSANSSRSNKAYGAETTSEFYYPNEGSPDGIDVRGDVARIALYQYVRWGNTEYMWGAAGVIESLDVLLDWMTADPVDTWEMGRNDAVQSITGTRNVFVDFPALAFDLFEEDAPADLDAPSYEELEGYTVEVTFSSNGAALSTVEATVGNKITLPAYTGTAPEGYEFVGWSASVVNHETTEPTVMAVGASYIVTGETTIHAVFTYEVEQEGGGSGSSSYEKVTSSADLTSGKYVIINEAGYAPVAKEGTWLTVEQPTVSGTTVTDTKNTEVTLTFNDDGTVIIALYDGTLIKPSASSNTISEGTYNWHITDGNDANTYRFSYDSSSGAASGTVLASNKSSSYKMRGYKVGTATLGNAGYPSSFTLYKETVVSGTVVVSMYTTHECEHTATTDMAAVAADCAGHGYTAGTECTACNAVLSGHTWIAPTGHDYEATITAPTITYTCSVCGDTYQTALTDYCTVNFSVPAGVAAVETVYVTDGVLELPAAGTPDETYVFAGWVTAEVSNVTVAPTTVYTEGQEIEIGEDLTLYALYTFTEGGSGSSDYEATELSKIGETDKVVITMTNNSTGIVYAMSNGNGTSSAPTASVVTVSDNKITSEVSDGIIWNIDNNNGNLTIYPNGTTATWLYCTNTNNGVCVGTGENKAFVVEDTYNYLYNSGTSRYVGVYNNADWRCYTTTPENNNIKNQTLTFYVKGEAGTTYYTTGTCAHANAHDVAEEPADCENPGYTAGVYCLDCEIYISGHAVIDALDHDYEAVVTPPTATEQGYTTYTCKNEGCGDSYRADFVPAVGETYTVTFWAPDYAYAPEATEGNLTGITLPAMTAPEGYTFLGWTAARVTDATEAPEYFKAGETYSVTADATLYALYTYSVGGSSDTGEYELVTDETQLAVGRNIVIVGAEAVEDVFYALSTNQKTSNRGGVAIEIDGAPVINEDVQILTLEAGAEAGTFAFNTGAGYLYAASSSGNQLKTKTDLDAKGSWQITVSEGVASIVSADTSVRGVMQFNPNNGSPLFACYESASQTALKIYVEVTGATTYYTTEYAVAANGENTWSKVSEALDAAATADTVKLVCAAFVSDVLEVYCTLDLAGYDLNTTAIVDASTSDSHIIDSEGTSFLNAAKAEDVKMFETNGMLAIDAANDGKLSYETVEIRQKNTAGDGTTKVNFYINKLADQTKLDESIGNDADVKIRLTVTWTEEGVQKTHHFVYTDTLVEKYMEDWDGRMFTCAITGLDELTDATVTAEVVSCGVVLQATVVA